MSRSNRAGLVALVGLALVGCLGTDTGNPPVAATLTARSGDPAVAVAPGVAEVVVNEAWVSIPDVRFILGSACDHVSASAATDLVGDVVVGVPTAFPEEVACGLQIVPGPLAVLPSGAPDALRGRSLLVLGQRADGALFEVSSDATAGIDVVSMTDDVVFVADAGVLVAFDVALLLGGVDLASIPLDSDGVARLGPGDPGSDAVGLAGSIAIYRDSDGDGLVGPAEEAAGPVAVSHGL